MSKPFTSFVVAGGTGNLGKPIVQSLVKYGFQVSILRRFESSNAENDENVRVYNVDYDDEKSLIDVIKGNQVVIDTLSVFRQFDGKGTNYSKNLATAASKANVELFIPNDFGMDHAQLEANYDLPIHPFHSGHVQFRKWLNEEVSCKKKKYPGFVLLIKLLSSIQLNLHYLTICNGMFANRGAFLRVSFADESKRSASLVGGGTNPFQVTNEKDIGHFLGCAFNTLSRDQLIDKQLYCVGARISWQELYSEVEKRTGEKWILKRIELETAKKMSTTNANPSNPAESIIAFVQYAQYMETLQELHNDNERVGFTPTINPVDAFMNKI